MWDYAPHKMDMCSGAPQPFDDASSVFVQPSNFSLQMGSQMQKALFFEYTDATFTTRKVHPAHGQMLYRMKEWITTPKVQTSIYHTDYANIIVIW